MIRSGQRRSNRFIVSCCVVSSVLAATSVCSDPATTSLTEGNIEVAPSEAEQTSLGFGEGSFIAVPIPFNDPTFGAGLLLGGGYLFQMDEDSSTSFLGLAAFKTSNGSLGYGLGGKVSLGDGRWNGSLFLGEVDLLYDLSVLGVAFPIRQAGAAARAEFQYGFTPDASAGFLLRYLGTEISLGVPGGVPPELDGDSDLELGTFGLVGAWDTLDSTFYPTTGAYADLEVSQTEFLKGGGSGYGKAVASFSGFLPVFENGVVGGRAVFCRAGSEAPFYDSCSLGGTDGLRGFPIGQFYGQDLASAQVEFRGRFSERFGYAAFVGGGQITESDLASTNGFRYAGGVGVRYRVAKDFGLDLSLDVAVNDENEDFVYLYVGQGF